MFVGRLCGPIVAGREGNISGVAHPDLLAFSIPGLGESFLSLFILHAGIFEVAETKKTIAEIAVGTYHCRRGSERASLQPGHGSPQASSCHWAARSASRAAPTQWDAAGL
jgi:hypothetical protein